MTVSGSRRRLRKLLLLRSLVRFGVAACLLVFLAFAVTSPPREPTFGPTACTDCIARDQALALWGSAHVHSRRQCRSVEGDWGDLERCLVEANEVIGGQR